MFAVQVNPNGSVAQLKSRLMAKGYTQTYGVDYSNTFSSVAKITYVQIFISLVATTLLLGMSFFMVTFRMRCIWSNLQGLLLRER